jgi:hypothetical protein
MFPPLGDAGDVMVLSSASKHSIITFPKTNVCLYFIKFKVLGLQQFVQKLFLKSAITNTSNNPVKR